MVTFSAATSFALQIPDKPQSYVNDTANLLSNTARGQLEQTLAQFEKDTSNQVVVAIFPSLEGGSLEDFSIHLAEKWKIGTKEHSNGVILLIFKEDRKMRIEVGYGLEGALPDLVCDAIIRHEIVPAFREGDFDRGVMNGVQAILAATKGEYKASGVSEDKIQRVAPFIFMGVFFFVFVLLKNLSFSGRTISGRRGGFWGPMVFYGGGFGGGFSGGGGFGGGGGGGFGGGGASGGW